MLDINGASALVTGGASGLGEATVRALGEQGAKVVIMDLEHQADKAEKILEDVEGAFMPTDVTDVDQVIAAVEKAKELGPVRALVNSAGIGWATRTIGKDGEYSSAHDLTVFRKVLEVNLVGTFNCIRLAATAMSGSDPDEFGERSAIVNTASVAALEGQIGQAAYSASKAGIVGMTLTIARDLAAVGVRVNTIIPGLFDTPIYGQGEASEQFKERLSVGCLFPSVSVLPRSTRRWPPS
ncbi:MAG: SDR family NAD(P)-dependent oxidoreductase [Microthrixaceae bacterium]|nr:SDR family NAD(P)-dependent oxidoreductase [Microthrixaceae bacterium]